MESPASPRTGCVTASTPLRYAHKSARAYLAQRLSLLKTNAACGRFPPVYGVPVGEVMGGAFSSCGVPLSFFRISSDALLMACCCFFMRSGTLGSGVELAAAGGLFEQEQIIPSKPAANRVNRIFLMSIFGCEVGTEWWPCHRRKRHRPRRLSTCPAFRDPRKRKTRDMEMPRVFGLDFFSRAYRGA
jgi:hypothetical protein